MADIKIEPGYTRATPMLSSFAASAHQWPYRVWFYTHAPLVTWPVHDRVYSAPVCVRACVRARVCVCVCVDAPQRHI